MDFQLRDHCCALGVQLLVTGRKSYTTLVVILWVRLGSHRKGVNLLKCIARLCSAEWLPLGSMGTSSDMEFLLRGVDSARGAMHAYFEV